MGWSAKKARAVRLIFAGKPVRVAFGYADRREKPGENLDTAIYYRLPGQNQPGRPHLTFAW
jgi:hypothetical protein